MSVKTILSITLAASAVVALASCDPAPARTRIVLITVDTLRYDGLVGRGDQQSPMPKMWKRALGGARFSRFYAATSVTQPTHATIFTALHPWEHGVTRNGKALDSKFETLAEILQRSGFETHAVVASFPLTERFGFAQGFDSYTSEFSQEGLEVWGDKAVPEGKFFSLADSITERAIDAIDSARGDQQFFWFHYFDPHAPYGVSRGEALSQNSILGLLDSGQSTAEELLALARRFYLSDLEYLDHSLDLLFARIEEDGEFATHVFVVSDHGESFGEKGSLAHGNRLTNVEIHIPAFVISPAIEPGLREDVAGTIDVAPTLLALAGVRASEFDHGGRDLFGASRSSAGAWGMRKTWQNGVPRERRLDGRVHRLPDFWFYAVDPLGNVHRGNREGVKSKSASHEAFTPERLVERFSVLEQQVRTAEVVEEVDPETAAALEALGYAP